MGFCNYFDDNSSAFTAEFITQKNYITEPDQLKSGNYLYLFASPRSTLRVLISYDGGQYESLGSVIENPQRFDLGKKKFYYFQLKVVESSSNKPFEVQAYTIDYDLEGERR